MNLSKLLFASCSFLVLLGLVAFSAKMENNLPIQFSGYIYFNPNKYDECDAETVGTVGVNNMKVNITSNKGEDRILATTGGLYDVDINTFSSNIISIVPEKTVANDFLNGISTFDLVLIQKHILGTATLNCPYTRIAADWNYSGAITALDMAQMRSCILAISCPDKSLSWRFAPNFSAPTSFTYQHITEFNKDFWDTDLAAPFNAKLSLMGKDYTYLGADTWMNGIKNWTYAPDDPARCRFFNYDFWLLKVGDLNGSANPYVTDNSGIVNFYDIDYLVEPASGTNANNEYELKVSVRSKNLLDGYQFGLSINTKAIQVSTIQSIQANLSQSTENYNTNPSELQAGHIRTSWSVDEEKVKQGIDISEWTEIMNLAITPLIEIDDKIDLVKLVQLDNDLLPSEFISGVTLLKDEEIDLIIELVPKK